MIRTPPGSDSDRPRKGEAYWLKALACCKTRIVAGCFA